MHSFYVYHDHTKRRNRKEFLGRERLKTKAVNVVLCGFGKKTSEGVRFVFLQIQFQIVHFPWNALCFVAVMVSLNICEFKNKKLERKINTKKKQQLISIWCGNGKGCGMNSDEYVINIYLFYSYLLFQFEKQACVAKIRNCLKMNMCAHLPAINIMISLCLWWIFITVQTKNEMSSSKSVCVWNAVMYISASFHKCCFSLTLDFFVGCWLYGLWYVCICCSARNFKIYIVLWQW